MSNLKKTLLIWIKLTSNMSVLEKAMVRKTASILRLQDSKLTTNRRSSDTLGYGLESDRASSRGVPSP